jgi:hypothetical protein
MNVEEIYKSGSVIPVSGVYRITHAAHRLPQAAILMQLEIFPTCAKCHGSVNFELLDSDQSHFPYEPLRLQELPLIPQAA